MSRQVHIRITKSFRCPLYRKEDELHIVPPSLHAGPAGFCLYLANQLSPVLLPRLESGEYADKPITLRCLSGNERYVEMVIRILDADLPRTELADDTQISTEDGAIATQKYTPTEAALAGVAIFAGLPYHKIARLAASLVLEQHDANQVLVEEGKVPRGLFLVAQGGVELSRTRDDGTPQPLGRRSRRFVFGERSLLGNDPSPVTIVTFQPTALAVLSRETFIDILSEDAVLLEEMVLQGFDEGLVEGDVLKPGDPP